ncbi:dienelactone hydrolase [Paraburkholderia graminis]|uniref:dienelactone hydrolase family protein n=1 Tax=Paraburkholderia graminis TaxID=60548 RepID=UPI00285D0D3D|nr:dienelactone hydrolase family protein [Paraburkholderia graminis]MDR6472184.1 dienelactone hydrolase [Paraburkholderia graminis]
MRPVFATRIFHPLPLVMALVLSGCGGSTSTLPTSTAPVTTPVATMPVSRMEVLPFQTLTLTDQEFLSGREDGTPITVAGELRLPRAGTDRLPLVIILHPAGGIGSNVVDWEQDLLGLGIATFVVDSFSGRGIVNLLSNRGELGLLAQVEDAYRALALLQKHARIDPTRVVLMGFSRGGRAALYANLKRWQHMHGPATNAEFAGYIAFYPGCDVTFRDDTDISTKPVRIFYGSADDLLPVAACRAYVERLKASGKNVQLTEYPGAQHMFDSRSFRQPTKLQQAPTTRNCQLVEAENGQIVNAKTKKPFALSDSCVEYGPTVAFDEEATKAARQAVNDFVMSILKPERSPS